jgi:hypothetical protein
MSLTIGDLRRAHQEGDRLLFWGAPAMMLGLSSGLGLAIVALWLATGDGVAFLAYVILVPLALSALFMPWAAVYTKHE